MDPADTKAPPVASFSINRFGARVILKSFPLYYILTPIFELNAITLAPKRLILTLATGGALVSAGSITKYNFK